MMMNKEPMWLSWRVDISLLLCGWVAAEGGICVFLWIKLLSKVDSWAELWLYNMSHNKITSTSIPVLVCFYRKYAKGGFKLDRKIWYNVKQRYYLDNDDVTMMLDSFSVCVFLMGYLTSFHNASNKRNSNRRDDWWGKPVLIHFTFIILSEWTRLLLSSLLYVLYALRQQSMWRGSEEGMACLNLFYVCGPTYSMLWRP